MQILNLIVTAVLCFHVRSIYDKYVLMIEGILEKFQESEGMNNHEFKVAMEDMQKIDPAMVKLIICTWEFGYFLDICKVGGICFIGEVCDVYDGYDA